MAAEMDDFALEAGFVGGRVFGGGIGGYVYFAEDGLVARFIVDIKRKDIGLPVLFL